MSIEICGTIGMEAMAQAVRDGLSQSGDVVELYVDSPGGDVIESNAMSLAIAEYALANPVKQYVCTLGSLCASAAANIVAKLPACFKVRAYKDTLVMFHSCAGVFEGNPQQLRDYSVMMEIVNEAVMRALMTKTNLDGDTVKAAFMSGRELWLDGAKAVECGLVDELLDASPEAITYSNDARTRQVLALVATYKQQHLEAKMEEEKKEEVTQQVIAESAPEVKAEEILEEEAKAETELEKEEIKKEVEKETEEAPEVDWEAKCGELRQECDELKKEVDALKALVAKYQPTAKPNANAVVKTDWLSMVRELNAKHLPEQEYAKEYIALKQANKPAFEAFMKSRQTR